MFNFSGIYNQTTFDVIQSHIDFFNEIKSVPKVIFYDNATTIYDIRTKKYNQRFLLCATHYQFTPNVCNPSSAHEKGSTERSVSVVRKAAFSEKIRFNSLADANDHLKNCLIGINNQNVHRRTKVPTHLLLEEIDSELVCMRGRNDEIVLGGDGECMIKTIGYWFQEDK